MGFQNYIGVIVSNLAKVNAEEVSGDSRQIRAYSNMIGAVGLPPGKVTEQGLSRCSAEHCSSDVYK